MIVKKFQAPTETEAIIKAREELGNGAVVLSVKTLKQRGIFRLFKKDVVEVTAALDEKEFAAQIKDTSAKPQFHVDRDSSGNYTARSSYASNASAKDSRTNSSINYVADEKVDIMPESTVIEEKLDSLHNLLRNQMEKDDSFTKEFSRDIGQPQPTAYMQAKKQLKERENTNFKSLQLIYNKLLENDVAEEYVNEIIGEIESSLKKESTIDSLLSGVYQKIILKLGEPKTITIGGKKPKVVFFIGPTGVGKTTTIAKLASKFKMDHQANVAFITADTYRIAAVEQLNTYASIIECPVSVVYTADEMQITLDKYKDRDLILVDTAGRSHKAEEQMLEIIDFVQSTIKNKTEFEYEVYLTLSVTTKYSDLKKITSAYEDIPNFRIIFTKLDETSSLGNILNIRLLTNAALSYTTSGQDVPTDIEVVNEQRLAKQLLGGNE